MGLLKKTEKILLKTVEYLGVEVAISDNLRLKSTLADLNRGFNSDITIILLFQEKGFAYRTFNNLTLPSSINRKKIINEFKKISGYSDKQCEWAFSIWNKALSKSDNLTSSKTHVKFFKVAGGKKQILIGDEVMVVWDILNYSQINLVKNYTEVIDITKEFSYKFKPTKNTSLHLKIKNINFYNPTKSNTIFINVLQKISLSFTADKKATIQGLPVKLIWNSLYATHISIQSNNGEMYNNLSKEGVISVCPLKDSVYTITAKHDLHIVEKKIYIYIKKAPAISNLKMPKIPKLTPNFYFISNSQLQSDRGLNTTANHRNSIEKIIKRNSIMFDFILNKISSNRIIKKINTYIYDEKISK